MTEKLRDAFDMTFDATKISNGTYFPAKDTLISIMESMKDIYGLDGAIIYIDDEANEILRCEAYISRKDLSIKPEEFSHGYDDTAFALTILQQEHGEFSTNPPKDALINKAGLDAFKIEGSMVGVPLIHNAEVVGVLIAWANSNPDIPTKEHIEKLQPFGRLAAAHIHRTAVLEKIREILTQMQTKLSTDENLCLILEGIQLAGFDRVRISRFDKNKRVFIDTDSTGMEEYLDTFSGYEIHLDDSPYAEKTANTASENTEARIYDPTDWYGPDPDAERLGKPEHLPWATVPLTIGGTLYGKIAADNAPTRREITKDSLNYLTVFGALAAQAIANAEMIEKMSARYLPALYSRLQVEDPENVVVRRLLVYLTCEEGLSFSRALFLKFDTESNAFVFDDGLGAISIERHNHVTQEAREKGIEVLLDDVERLNNAELIEAMKGFSLNTESPIIADLIRVETVVQKFPNYGSSTPPDFFQDLRGRMKADQILMAPIRTGEQLFGVFIVDRKWQQRELGEADKISLRMFAQQAAQILKQHSLLRQILESRDLATLGFVTSGLTHEMRQPIGSLQYELYNFRVYVQQNNFHEAVNCAGFIEKGVDRLVHALHALESLIHPQEEMVSTNIPELLKDLSTFCEQRAHNHGIDFKVNMPAQVPEVLAIPKLMGQALLNLIINAQEALEKVRKPNRKIEVNLQVDDEWLTIEIRDNGLGISPDNLQKIRTPGAMFTTNPRKDLGLGIEIARKAAEAHHGVFDIQSELDSGTSAMLRIPISKVR